MSERLLAVVRPVIAGGLIGLVAFGGAFVALHAIKDAEFARSLTEEDGFIETIGAAAFAVAAMLQFALYWRSDVPVRQRLVSFLRRNPFHLALAAALFLAFAEEISWGQRILGWETPDALLAVNRQSETNIHNLELFQGIFSLTRLWNFFWLGYCFLLPISNAASPILAALYRRISMPVPPLWIAGLFVGCYASFRVYITLTAGSGLAEADEAKEAFLAICWVVLGVAQLRQSYMGGGEKSNPPGATDLLASDSSRPEGVPAD